MDLPNSSSMDEVTAVFSERPNKKYTTAMASV